MRFRCAIAHTREESDCASESGDEEAQRSRSGGKKSERNTV